MRAHLLGSICLLAIVATALPASAEQKDDPETRLRAALKSATTRIRDLEDQNAQLTARQAEAERDKQAAAQKLADDEKELGELRQQTTSDKSALEQAGAQQQQLQTSLTKWQSSYNEAAEAARTRDADAKQLTAVLSQLRPRVQSCEAKNAALYKIGEDVLDLYEKKDFLDLVSGEPVTKLKRVDLENAMQDYEDKMRDNRIGQPATGASR